MTIKIDVRARTTSYGESLEYSVNYSSVSAKDYMTSKVESTVPRNNDNEQVDFLDYVIDSNSYERKYTGDESFIASYLVNRLNYPVDTVVRIGKDKVTSERKTATSYIKCDGKMYYKELTGYGVREAVIKK